MQEKQLNNIFYKEFGEKNNKETIVILHGWGGKSDSWIEVGTLLEKNGYHVIIPDLPGFGKTKLEKVFTLDDYVDEVEKFVEEYFKQNPLPNLPPSQGEGENVSSLSGLGEGIQGRGVDKIVLWGHSNGGGISVKIANSGKLKIKKLILNNSAGIRKNKERNFKRKFFSAISKPFKFLGKIKFVRKTFYKLIGGQDYLKSEETPFLKETYLNIINEDLSEDIKKLEIDTLLIRGEKDTYTPLKTDGYFFRDHIKNSKFIVLDNEKHGIHLQNPERLVKTFLENI